MANPRPLDQLVEFWKNFDCSDGRHEYIHSGDEILAAHRWMPGKPTDTDNHEPPDVRSVRRYWAGALAEVHNAFHVSLLPVPYLGDLSKADIFVLMMNPGLGYPDYGTDADPRFRQALRSNVSQTLTSGTPCLALDPRYWWSSWFDYYETMLRRTTSRFAAARGYSYSKALTCFADRLAILQLVPYYSTRAGWITPPVIERLASSSIARKAAHSLRARAKRGEVLVVVRWAAQQWQIQAAENIVLPPLNNTRYGMHQLGENAIVEWLAKHPRGADC